MANHLSDQQRDEIHAKVLHAAALLFVEKGYAGTTTRELAAQSGIQVSAMNRAFGSKEHILSELVRQVLDAQFALAEKMLATETSDEVLRYALEAALQLYMAECSEAIRDLYCNVYALSETSELLLRTSAETVIAPTFGRYLPDYTLEDFYQLEIASGSIIRGYMTVRCDESFPAEMKVTRFLETALRIYRVPQEKISEAIDFVKQFDLWSIAQESIRGMLEYLECTEYTAE